MSSKNASQWLLSQNRFQSNENRDVSNIFSKAKVISVASGKGGVGKTSVAIKMSHMLAKQGKRVLLIDCDYNLSNTRVKMGLPMSEGLHAYVTGQKTFHECLYKEGNFHLLGGSNGNIDVFDNGIDLDNVIIDILVKYEKDYDYIFLDCPAGISRRVLNLNAYSDHRVIVITPDRSSITDSYSLMKILKTKYGVGHNCLVVNKVSSEPQYRRMVRIVSETVENFLQGRIQVLGGIEKEDGAVDQFDQILLSGENYSLHESFAKVVEQFTEIVSDVSVPSAHSAPIPLTAFHGVSVNDQGGNHGIIAI